MPVLHCHDAVRLFEVPCELAQAAVPGLCCNVLVARECGFEQLAHDKVSVEAFGELGW